MTRKSRREIERALDDAGVSADEPPHAWMEGVPQKLWTDPEAAWRYALENPDADVTELEAGLARTHIEEGEEAAREQLTEAIEKLRDDASHRKGGNR